MVVDSDDDMQGEAAHVPLQAHPPQERPPRLAPLPDGTHALDALRAAWPFKLDTFLPEVLGPYLHSATVEALGSFVPDKFQGMPMLYTRYDIYTDGSGGSGKGDMPGPPAWAFVVIGTDSQGERSVIGYLGQAMPVLAEIFVQPSVAAEICAGVAAVLWLLQLHRSCGMEWAHEFPELHLHTDCQYVVDIAKGGASLATYKPYSLVLDGLTKLLKGITHFHWKHVPGHMADGFNELADTIATLARGGLITAPFGMEIWDQLMQYLQEVPWLWLAAAPPRAQLQYPVPGGPVPSLDPPTLGLRDFLEGRLQGCPIGRGRGSSKQDTPVLKLAVANVLTLDPRKSRAGRGKAFSGVLMPGRVLMLAGQFGVFGYHFVGTLETRVPTDSSIRVGDYKVFHSAANSKGYLGVSLWVNVREPLGKGPPLTDKSVAIIHSDPRRLLASIRSPTLALDIFVGHAPHSGAPKQAIREWWRRTKARLRGRPAPAKHLVCLLDANARVGQFTTEGIGKYGAAKENLAGEALRHFTEDTQVCLPSTLLPSRGGASTLHGDVCGMASSTNIGLIILQFHSTSSR